MIRTLALAAALAAVPAAVAAEPVTLRAEPSAAGEAVTLGDLFDVSGEASQVAVARAPRPGGQIQIEGPWLQAFAAQHGLQWANAGNLARIAVTRESREIGESEISALIADQLRLAGDADRYQIEFAPRGVTLHAPAGSIGEPRVLRFDYNARAGAFAAEIEPYRGGPVERVAGRAWAAVEVPALTRPVAAGEIITEADIAWTETRADRLRQDAIFSAAALVGMEAKRALQPNRPLRGYDVKRPAAIEKGALVTVVYQRPGLTLTARGRALEEAAEGQSLRIVNQQSNRTIEAVAAGPGRAVVRDTRYVTASLDQKGL